MTAHDPRVTLTEGESREEVGALCPQCSHRVIWHHDERGCQYHGNGENGCPCALDSDQTVERIIAARLDRVRAVAEQWEQRIESSYHPDCVRRPLEELRNALDAPQDAPRGPVGGEQDHDGGEGQGDAASELRRLHRIGTTPVGEVPPGDAAFYESHPLRDMTGGYARDFRLMVAEWLETR